MKTPMLLAVAVLLSVSIVGCGGSEYRFGNQKNLPNLSGQWTFAATSQSMSQQFHGTASVAQSNLAVQGSVTNLFAYCASSATLSGVLTPPQTFDTTSPTSYTLTITLQEDVGSGENQEIVLIGSASGDGTRMSGTYTASAGTCTAGDAASGLRRRTDETIRKWAGELGRYRPCQLTQLRRAA